MELGTVPDKAQVNWSVPRIDARYDESIAWRYRSHVTRHLTKQDDSAGSCRLPKIMTKTISNPSSSLSLIISSEFN